MLVCVLDDMKANLKLIEGSSKYCFVSVGRLPKSLKYRTRVAHLAQASACAQILCGVLPNVSEKVNPFRIQVNHVSEKVMGYGTDRNGIVTDMINFNTNTYTNEPNKIPFGANVFTFGTIWIIVVPKGVNGCPKGFCV